MFILRLNTAENTDYIEKCFLSQVVQNCISYKNFTERICLSSLIEKRGSSKDLPHSYTSALYFKNGKSLEAPSPTTEGFCRKYNFGRLLIKVFFDIISTFGNVPF